MLYLQVFFNLESLPEIVLLAVHTTVRRTVDLSAEALDLDTLVAANPELATSAAVPTGSLALGSTSKRAAAAAAAHAAPMAFPVSPQLRVALREAAHQWSALVFDQAMQIHVLQRVVAKKEDPTSHVRFIDVLRAVGNSSGSGSGATALLASGKLLELFWSQLCLGLQDVAADKLKSQPLAASRIYPFLRKAAVDIVDNLKVRRQILPKAKLTVFITLTIS
jgi:hypothetical protein